MLLDWNPLPCGREKEERETNISNLNACIEEYRKEERSFSEERAHIVAHS
jgi:hypothetical protein